MSLGQILSVSPHLGLHRDGYAVPCQPADHAVERHCDDAYSPHAFMSIPASPPPPGPPILAWPSLGTLSSPSSDVHGPAPVGRPFGSAYRGGSGSGRRAGACQARRLESVSRGSILPPFRHRDGLTERRSHRGGEGSTPRDCAPGGAGRGTRPAAFVPEHRQGALRASMPRRATRAASPVPRPLNSSSSRRVSPLREGPDPHPHAWRAHTRIRDAREPPRAGSSTHG